MPSFSVARKQGQKSQRKCMNCGILLDPSEIEYCIDCRPINERAKADSKLKRQLEDESKHLSKITSKVGGKTITVKVDK
jgi:hypothetical protein